MNKIFLAVLFLTASSFAAHADGIPGKKPDPARHTGGDGGGAGGGTGGGGGTTTPPPAGSPTRVQQLTVNLAYEQREVAEYGPGTYHSYRLEEVTHQLAAAIAAAAAGHPLPPALNDNGSVVSLIKSNGGVESGPEELY